MKRGGSFVNMIIKTRSKVSFPPDSFTPASLNMSPVALLHPPAMPLTSSLKNGTAHPLQSVRHPAGTTSFAFDKMEHALAAFGAGEFLVVMDDEDRENEGDIIISASHCTTEKMAWMIKHTRCVQAVFHLTSPCHVQLVVTSASHYPATGWKNCRSQ